MLIKWREYIGFILLILLYLEKLSLPFPILQSTYHLLRIIAIIALFLVVKWDIKERAYAKVVGNHNHLYVYLFSQTVSAAWSKFPGAALGPLSHIFIAIIGYLFLLRISQKSKHFADKSILIINGLLLFSSILAGLAVVSPEIVEIVWQKTLWGNVYQGFMFDFGRGRVRPIGAAFVTSLIPLYYLLNPKISKYSLKWWIGGLSLAGSLYTIVLMGYRNYIFNFLIGLTSMIIFLKNKKIISNPAPKWIITLVILLILLNPKIFYQSLSRFFTDDESSLGNSIKSRLELVNVSSEILSNNLWLGVGPGSFGYWNEPLKIGVKFQRHSLRQFLHEEFINLGPHNIFLQTLAETGILGLAAFVVLIYTFATEDIRLLVSPNDFKTIILVSPFWLFLAGSVVDVFPPYAFSISLALRAVAKGRMVHSDIK